MATLAECLKKIDYFTDQDRVEIQQVAKKYIKEDKLDGPAASIRAIDEMLKGERTRYTVLEAKVREAGGRIDSVDVYEKKFRGESPAPTLAEATAAPKAASDDVGASPAEPAEVADAVATDLSARAFRQGARNRLEKAVEASDMDMEDVLPFLKEDKDGKIGAKQIRKAMKDAEAEQAELEKRMEEAGGLDIEARKEEYEGNIAALDKLISESTDEKEIAEYLELMTEYALAYQRLVKEEGGTVTLEMNDRDINDAIMKMLTEQEQAKVKQIQSLYKKKGVSNTQAKQAALLKVMGDRIERNLADTIKKEDAKAGITRETSATGRAAKRLETGEKKAGIGKSGIQSNLKSGTPIAKGSDYTIMGRGLSGAYKGLDNFDEDGVANGFAVAEAQAALSGKKDPIEFTAVEKTHLGDDPSNPLGKGDRGYYDPLTGKAYRDFDNMMVARGEKAQMGKAEVAATTRSFLEGSLKPEDVLAKIEKKRAELALAKEPQAKQDAIKGANELTDVKDGYVLALRSANPRANGKYSIRVLSEKQLANGGGVEMLLGKSKPVDWVVGQAPRGTKSGQKFASKWEPAGEKTPDKAPEKIPNQAKRAMPVAEFDKGEVTDPEVRALIGEILNVADLESKVVTNVNLRNAIAKVESSPWRASSKWHQDDIERLEKLYAYQASVAPNGVARDVATRKQAIQTLDEIMSGHPADEVAAMKQLISRLSQDTAPVFNRSTTQDHYVSFDSELDNHIELNVGKDSRVTPLSTTFSHELGHWAYHNILTNEDRLAFWASAKKYIDDGGDLLGERSPSKTEHTDGFIVYSNEFKSPQEFFANQFSMWVQQNPALKVGDPTFWKRLTHYFKALFDRFVDKKAIDPELEPLFAKIIPDVAEEARFAAKKPLTESNLQSNVSKYIVHNYREVEIIDDNLRTALLDGNPEEIMNAAGEMVVIFKKLVPSKRRASAEGREITGAFGPITKMRNQIRSKANQLANILKGSGEEGPTLVETPHPDLYDEYGYSTFEWQPAEGADTVFDAGKAEAIAAKVAEFMSDENRKHGSLDKVLDDLYTTLTASLREYEGADVFIGDLPEVPKSMKGIAANLPKENARAKFFKARAKARAQNKKQRVAAKAAAWAKGHGEKLPSSGVELPSMKGMSTRQLVTLYDKHGKTKEGEQILEELVRQSKLGTPAEKPPKINKAVAKEIYQAKTPDLDARIADALENGRKDEVTAIIWEMQRRLHNRAAKKSGAVRIAPIKYQSTEITRAIGQELADGAEGTIDGIPQAARLTVREAMTYITHRNPEIQTTARTMLYRMFNLMGRAQKGVAGNANLMSMEDIYRLSRSTKSPTAAGVMADFTSDEFKMLRSDMRKLAVGLNRDTASPFDVMHEIGHVLMRTNVISDSDRALIMEGFNGASDDIKTNVMKRRYSDEMPESVRLERQAEEWFVEHWAQYLGERVTKGDIFSARADNSVTGLQLKSSLEAFIDRLIEAAAYVVNGLIGRKDVKQVFRRLTLFGDAFDVFPHKPSPSTRPVVSTESAATRFREAWDNSSPSRKEKIRTFTGEDAPAQMYHGTPNMKIFEDGEIVFKPSTRGNNGGGIYVTSDPNIAQGVYANKPTFAAWERIIDASELPDDDKLAAKGLARELAAYRSTISQSKVKLEGLKLERDAAKDVYLKDDFSELNKVALDVDAEIISTRNLVDSLEAMEESVAEELASLGLAPDSGVLPVYVRALNSFGATRSDWYGLGDAMPRNLMRFAYSRMREVGADNDLVTHELSPLMRNINENGGIDGHSLYRDVSRAMVNAGLDQAEARQGINRYLAEQGYDSINSIHTNTLDGTITAHQTTVLIETPDGKGGWISPSNRIKHQDAREFDMNDDRLYYSDPADLSPSAALGKAAVHNQDLDVEMAHIFQQLEEKGTPKGFINAARSIGRGRKLSQKELDEVRSSSAFTRTLQSNSQRMRSVGMNWLADFSEDFFPSKANMFGRSYMPINHMLNRLPDAHSWFREWAGRSNPLRKGQPKQPESHRRILEALRMGVGSPFYQRLSASEREIAERISLTFDEMHKSMKEEGVMVGNIKDYVPQVWDVDAIRANRDLFVERMEGYLMSEDPARERGRATEIAEHITAKLIDNDGLYVPPPVSSRAGVENHIDFQRLIRLDRHKGHYDEEFGLGGFLVNDLRFLLVRYMDGAARRIHQTQKMGINNHAYADYLDVGQHGVEAIVRQLSSPRVFTKTMKGQVGDSPDGPVELFNLDAVMEMPFNNKEDAYNAALEAISQYRKHGIGAARTFLLEQMPPDKMSKTYAHRVDAIIHAIDDFDLDAKGRPSKVHSDEFHHAEGVLRALQGKQVNPFTSEKTLNASRLLRAFNNVSLLTYTMLTSIPDTTLPLIRSGSFQDWAKGITKYASDPDYRREIQAAGVAIENEVHGRQIGMYGADVQGRGSIMQNAFFNATMLTPWTDMWRGVSGAIALESFKTQHKRAMRVKIDGAEPKDQPREFKFAHRYLSRYGLAHALDDANFVFDPESVDTSKGLVRFADDTIFSPNPNDVPLWAQTPGGAILFQLKSFPVMMGRLVYDAVLTDLRSGDMRRPAYFLAFAPMMGAGSLAIKDVVQGRGGEDGESADVRVRNFAKMMGHDEDVHGNAQDFLGWYLEGLGHAGGFGFLAEVLHDIAQNADNGAWGFVRAAGTVAGPSLGTGYSAFNVLGGVSEVTLDQFGWGSSDTNAKERQAVREVVGRTPFIGGNKAAREGLTDLFAGEKEEGGEGGFGSGFGGGFGKSKFGGGF